MHTERAGGRGGHGAHQPMVGICAARLRAHCGEKFGCLLVPQLACRKYGYKHDMEGLYEGKVMLFHVPVHWWLNLRYKTTGPMCQTVVDLGLLPPRRIIHVAGAVCGGASLRVNVYWAWAALPPPITG